MTSPFTPSDQHGQTVTFVHRQLTGEDQYGNDVYGKTNVDVPGCVVAPGNTSENFQGTLQITSDVTVYTPAGTTVDLPVDQMIINGVTYNVVGNPNNWSSPWTGTGSFQQVEGKLVTTGGAAT